MDLHKMPIVLWDAEWEIGHHKSPRIGVSVDNHQARISLERWRPSWGVESTSLSTETTGVYDSDLNVNSSHLFYDPPSFLLAAESLRIRPGVEEFAFPLSSSTKSTVRCLSAKRAIADHPSAVYSLVHITRVFVDTGASQTEDPAALILGKLVFSFFSPRTI